MCAGDFYWFHWFALLFNTMSHRCCRFNFWLPAIFNAIFVSFTFDAILMVCTLCVYDVPNGVLMNVSIWLIIKSLSSCGTAFWHHSFGAPLWDGTYGTRDGGNVVNQECESSCCRTDAMEDISMLFDFLCDNLCKWEWERHNMRKCERNN